MIIVTERAAAKMQELLAARGAGTGEGMRIAPSASGGYDLTIGPAADGDEVVRRGGAVLLIVEESIAPSLDGAVIDAANQNAAGNAPRFTLRPPERP